MSSPSSPLDPSPSDPFRSDRESKPVRHLDETSGFESAPRQDETSEVGGSTKPAETRAGTKRRERTISGYRLGELLGQGGMGRVFRAEDSSGHAVALKLLSPDLACSSEAMARFKQEGLIASQINHPHCVFVHRVDEDAGTPFIAMELMTGKTLKDIVLERGPLPCTDAVRLILQCIEGLIEAHSLGMIHRDIKPANCYLDEEGNVKIGDFGLARSLVSDSELTQTGAFLGTPLFASPEQLLGQSIDARSDIYSLTATLYFLLAGKAPFESPHAAQVIARIASSDPPSFASVEIDVPPDLERIVMKGLARDASKRYDSFAQMRDDLKCIVAPKPKATSLTRRSLAWIADYFVVTTIISLVLFMCFKANELRDKSLAVNALGGLLLFLYYFISEACFATSLGKAAMRIKVYNVADQCRLTIRQALLRSASYALITSSLLLLFKWFLPDMSSAFEGFLVVAILLANVGILLSSWWATGKRQLLHDWLSFTECRTDYGARSQIVSTLSLPAWSLPLASGPNSDSDTPKTLGRFRIDGRIQSDAAAGVEWLTGNDPQLDRCVWIACFADKSIEYEEQLQRLPKSRRLRYIDEGLEPRYRWFAYVAAEGVPLRECLASNIQFPWPITRSLLGAFAGDSTRDASVAQEAISPERPAPWSPKRWWIDSAGRLSLVDFEYRDFEYRASSEPREENGAAFSRQSFVQLLALLGLPSRHPLRRKHASHRMVAMPPEHAGPREETHGLAVEELPPLRSLALLESLASQRIVPTPIQLAESLDRIDHGAHKVTGSARFIAAAVSLGLMSPWLLFGLMILAIPSLITFMDQSRYVRQLKSLQAFSSEPDVYCEAWALAPAGAQQQWTADAARERVRQALGVESKRLSEAHLALGTLERFILSTVTSESYSVTDPPMYGPPPKSTPTNSDGPESESPKAEVEGKDTKEPGNFRIVAGNVTLMSSRFGNEELTGELVDSIVGCMDGPPERRGGNFPDTITLAIGILLCVLWTTLTLGGLTQYFTGSCIVRRNGCRLGFLRSWLRATLLYTPFLAIGIWTTYGNDGGLDWIWVTTQLKRAFLLIPILYLVLTIRWSQRTPLDVLAGTASIPR
jgi:eukaryotic-like serine/threonine-protein kinase